MKFIISIVICALILGNVSMGIADGTFAPGGRVSIDKNDGAPPVYPE